MRLAFLTLMLVTGWGSWLSDSVKLVKDQVRWFLETHVGYAEKIEIQMYLLNREQVADLLADPDNVCPIQKTEAELSGRPQYFVFRAVNSGGHGCSGTLSFYIDEKYLDTLSLSCSWSLDFPQEYVVLPLGERFASDSKEVPHLSFKWKELEVVVR